MSALLRTVAVAALAPVLAGCWVESVEASAAVASADVHLAVTSTGTARGTTIVVEVDGPDGALKLTGGDALEATLGGYEVTFEEQPRGASDAHPNGDAPLYRVDVGNLAGPFDVGLARGHERPLGPFRVELPSAFDAWTDEDMPGALGIDWTYQPDEPAPAITVSGTCIAPLEEQPTPDQSRLVVTDLAGALGAGASPCPLEVSLVRSTVVTESQAGGAFSAQASQTRSATAPWPGSAP